MEGKGEDDLLGGRWGHLSEDGSASLERKHEFGVAML